MSILYFIIGLGLLIFIHEFGHFIVAKAKGVRVERFSLGFGPRLIKVKWGETEYCISALPLGGYVKMTGQEDFEEEEIVPIDDPRAFSSKSLWTRLSVVFAGPIMNLLLPFILMPIVFMLGQVEPKYLSQPPEIIGVRKESPAEKAGIQKGDMILSIDDHKVKNWGEVLRQSAKPAGTTLEIEGRRNGQTYKKSLTLAELEKGAPGLIGFEPMFFVDTDPIIGGFRADSPAKEAGMKSDDVVVAINGEPTKTWSEMSKKVNASAGKELLFTVQRGDSTEDLKITPIFNKEHEKYIIGVSKGSNPDLYEKRQYPFGEAVVLGFEKNIYLFGLTFKVLGDLITLKASYKELGGPIRIAQISARAAKKGVGNFLFLLAFLSINLGILNLLPIPVLDGGHVVFMMYEGIARKPLSAKKRLIAQQVGMFLLLTLMIVVTVNDIDAVWGFKDILAKIRGFFG